LLEAGKSINTLEAGKMREMRFMEEPETLAEHRQTKGFQAVAIGREGT
jgi:hypothetical protein